MEEWGVGCGFGWLGCGVAHGPGWLRQVGAGVLGSKGALKWMVRSCSCSKPCPCPALPCFGAQFVPYDSDSESLGDALFTGRAVRGGEMFAYVRFSF